MAYWFHPQNILSTNRHALSHAQPSHKQCALASSRVILLMQNSDKWHKKKGKQGADVCLRPTRLRSSCYVEEIKAVKSRWRYSGFALLLLFSFLRYVRFMHWLIRQQESRRSNETIAKQFNLHSLYKFIFRFDVHAIRTDEPLQVNGFGSRENHCSQCAGKPPANHIAIGACSELQKRASQRSSRVCAQHSSRAACTRRILQLEAGDLCT